MTNDSEFNYRGLGRTLKEEENERKEGREITFIVISGFRLSLYVGQK